MDTSTTTYSFADWRESVRRLGDIFVERFREIRSDFDPDRMVEAAVASVSKSPPAPMGTTTVSMRDGPMEVDMSVMLELINQINKGHKDRIFEIANSIGSVVEEVPLRTDFAEDISGRYAGEDELHVFMVVEGMKIRIEKEVALKVLALGCLP